MDRHQKLKIIRLFWGWRQTDLARLMNVHQGVIAKYEQNRCPKRKIFEDFGTKTKWPLPWLLGKESLAGFFICPILSHQINYSKSAVKRIGQELKLLLPIFLNTEFAAAKISRFWDSNVNCGVYLVVDTGKCVVLLSPPQLESILDEILLGRASVRDVPIPENILVNDIWEKSNWTGIIRLLKLAGVRNTLIELIKNAVLPSEIQPVIMESEQDETIDSEQDETMELFTDVEDNVGKAIDEIEKWIDEIAPDIDTLTKQFRLDKIKDILLNLPL